MFSFLPGFILGPVTLILLILNLILFAFILFYPVALLKWLIPNIKVKVFLSNVLTTLAEYWVSGNSLIFKSMLKIDWQIEGEENIKYLNWNLLICNHRSWVDILVLLGVFNLKIPFPRFFLKEELRKIPVLGLCWWALDFPFMKRYSMAQIRKNPELKGKDLETTKKACDVFKRAPVSIINFLEGTRFTIEKHKLKASNYEMLLTPKSGGVSIVLSEMRDYLEGIYDITVFYPEKATTVWDFLSGRLKTIKVHIEQKPIPEQLLNDEARRMNDSRFRKLVQHWLNDLWEEKDQRLLEWQEEQLER